MTIFFNWGDLLKTFALHRVRSKLDHSSNLPLGLKFEQTDRFIFACSKEALLAADGSAPGILSEVFSTNEKTRPRSERVFSQDVFHLAWEAWQEFRGVIEAADTDRRILWCRDGERWVHDAKLHWFVCPDGIKFKILHSGETKKINNQNPGVVPGYIGSLPTSNDELSVLEGIALNGGTSLEKGALSKVPQTQRFDSEQLKSLLDNLLREELIEDKDNTWSISWDLYALIESP